MKQVLKIFSEMMLSRLPFLGGTKELSQKQNFSKSLMKV